MPEWCIFFLRSGNETARVCNYCCDSLYSPSIKTKIVCPAEETLSLEKNFKPLKYTRYINNPYIVPEFSQNGDRGTQHTRTSLCGQKNIRTKNCLQ